MVKSPKTKVRKCVDEKQPVLKISLRNTQHEKNAPTSLLQQFMKKWIGRCENHVKFWLLLGSRDTELEKLLKSLQEECSYQLSTNFGLKGGNITYGFVIGR